MSGISAPPQEHVKGLTNLTDLNLSGTQVTDAGMVEFEVRCGATKMGNQVDGYPQERIRRPHKNPPYDSGGLNGAPGTYYLAQGVIFDHKQTQVPPEGVLGWNSLPIGFVMDHFYQENRMVIKDCDFNEQYFPLGERHFQKVKTGTNSWQLQLVP